MGSTSSKESPAGKPSYFTIMQGKWGGPWKLVLTPAELEALPEEADLTCLEIDRDYTRLAAATLAGRPANFMVGKAMDALERFEAEGTVFDFISLDADKPLHGEYFNMSLKLRNRRLLLLSKKGKLLQF